MAARRKPKNQDDGSTICITSSNATQGLRRHFAWPDRTQHLLVQAVTPAWKRGSSLTSEQLEAARSERMRQSGIGAISLEDARTWLEETGLCLFLPKRQYSSALAPSFVEAVAGQKNSTPDPAYIALAEELLVRLEKDGVAVR